MKEKIVVTGGAGFVGANLVDALLEKGFEVHVIDNYAGGKGEDRINPKGVYHNVDIRDFQKIAPLIAGAKYVFHEAALPRVQFSIENPQETFAVNVDGLVSVLRAAHQGEVGRVVYAASSSAYGDQVKLPLSEASGATEKSLWIAEIRRRAFVPIVERSIWAVDRVAPLFQCVRPEIRPERRLCPRHRQVPEAEKGGDTAHDHR